MGMRDDREHSEMICFSRAMPVGISSLVLWLLSASCVPPQAPAQPTISLRVRGTPPSATVVVDEEALGTLDFVAAHGVALPPGVHHVTVTARGYFPSDTEVDARPGSPPVRLEVALTPVPD
jgi:PEGA domain-containing protein